MDGSVGSGDSRVSDFLAHYGVKGMKWGVRRAAKGPSAAEAEKKATVKTAVRKQGIRTVSNKDLQDAINRMNLEQQFKRLSVNERPAVTRFISSTLMNIGKQQVAEQAGRVIRKSVTGV